MIDALCCCFDGVQGSILADGELSNNGAKAEGLIVFGGVCGMDTAAQCALLFAVDVDNDIVSVNIGRDRAGLMLSFARPWYGDV